MRERGRERDLLGLNCEIGLQNLVELLAHGGFLVDYFVDLRYDGPKERRGAEKEKDAEDLPKRRRTEVGIAGEEWFWSGSPARPCSQQRCLLSDVSVYVSKETVEAHIHSHTVADGCEGCEHEVEADELFRAQSASIIQSTMM